MKKGPTNPQLKETIEKLRKTKKKSCLLIANKLESATRRRPEVNLWKIDKYSKEGDLVVVPGKVLSEGELSHSIGLVAFNLSKKAEEKVKGKAKLHSFDYLVKEKPKKIKVIT
jgi:large subunit ribosomal protein L18e